MNKSIIKIYWFFIQIYIIYILLLKLNLNIKGISGNAIEWILFPIIIDIFIFILSLIICVYKRKILRANTKVKKAVDTIYLREPPYKYSPVITTYIQNLKIEPDKDLISEITFLHIKKCINIIKNDKGYFIEKNNFEPDDLLNAEQLILGNIPTEGIYLKELLQKMKTINKYVEEEYIEDCKKLGYVIEGKDLIEKSGKKINLVNVCTFIIMALLLVISIIIQNRFLHLDALLIIIETMSNLLIGIVFGAMMQIIITILTYTLISITLFRTKKAKEDYSNWIAFIEFLKDNTYIKDKKIDDLIIWDDYITYAIAFNIINYKELKI